MIANKRTGWFTFLRILAKDTKLKFKVGSPATDGKTVWLPALPAELTEEDLILFKGDSFHEVGHIQFSDIPYFMEFAKQGDAHRFLLNALDDVFMEGASSSWKKMAENFIRSSTLVLIKRNKFIDGSKSLVEALGAFILVYLTAKRWPEVGEPLPVIVSNLEKHLGRYAPVVIPELTNLLDAQFPLVKSTRDAGALTLQIIEMLQELAEQDQSESESLPQAGNDSDDGEGSQPNGGSDEKDDAGGESNASESGSEGKSGGGAGEGDEEAGEEGDAGAGSNQDQGGQPQGSSSGIGGSNDEAEESAESNQVPGVDGSEGSTESDAAANTGKALKELIAEMLDSEVGTDEIFDKAKAVAELAEEIAKGENPDYKGVEIIGDLEVGGVGAGALIELSDGIVTLPRDKSAARVLKRELARSKGKDIARLRALLSTSTDTDPYTSRTGRLSEQYLHRFALGDNRLFERTDERMEPKASVSIAADLSGSTLRRIGESTIANEIQRTLFMLETVLNDIGAPREMFGFAPVTGNENSVIRSFNDNHMVACERIGAMLDMVGGSCTPICTAVNQASRRLLKQRTRRKLLFVVTDGVPSDVERAKEETAQAVAQGIEVLYFVLDPRGRCSDWLHETNIPVINIKAAGQLFEALAETLTEHMR